MDSFTLADAKQLCTAGELRIVTASLGSRLEKLDGAGLKKHIVDARKLRDKWRDVATTQRRKTQRAQNARDTDKNARSQKKAQIFDEALARFESRLSQVDTAAPPAAPAATVKTPPTKQARSQGHRQSRATVRDALREKQQMLSAAKKKSPTAAKKTASRPASPPPASKPPAKAAGKKKAPQKTAPPRSPVSSVKMTNDPVANPAKNRAAKTAAKQARLQVSGLKSRTKGHVSAQTRKRQGKRDAHG